MSAPAELSLAAVILLPALVAVAARAVRVGPRVPAAALGCATALAAVVAVATVEAPVAVADGTAVALVVDRVAALLVVAVLLVGWVAMTYLGRSVDAPDARRRLQGLAGALLAGTVLVSASAGLVALAAGWLVASAALVALLARPDEVGPPALARRRARRSLLVGDLALLGAVAVVVGVTGSWSPGSAGAAELLAPATVAGLPALDVVAVLLVVAGVARSALVPLHRWLVPTIAAPTPVSVLLHAGFISGAGVLVLRTAPLVTGSAVAAHLLFALAVATVAVGTLARRQRADGKGELAWSTVAQMGFMGVQCAVGALGGALFHIIGHGLYKAARFLEVGDAPVAALARRRHPAVTRPAPTGVRLALASVVPAVGLGLGWAAAAPHLRGAAVVLVATFAWAAGAQALWGALARTSASPTSWLPVVGAGLVLPAAYVVGLGVVEGFVGDDLATVGAGVVGTPLLVAALVGVLAAAAAVRWWPGAAGEQLRDALDAAALDLAEDRPTAPGPVRHRRGAIGRTDPIRPSPRPVPVSSLPTPRALEPR